MTNSILTVILILIIALTNWGNAQNTLTNGSFELMHPCPEVPQNLAEPQHWFTNSFGKNAQIVGKGLACLPQVSIGAQEGNNFLRIGFEVNTVGVSPQYIQTKLERPLKKDSLYQIEMYVLRDALSLGDLRELQVLFNSGEINEHHALWSMENNPGMLTMSLKDVSSVHWTPLSITYKATGMEHYLILGSLFQKFRFGEGMKNYGAERTQNNQPNVIYYVDNINITPLNLNYPPEAIGNNITDLFYPKMNLIRNSGFEDYVSENRRLPDGSFYANGIAEGWLNLKRSGTTVLAFDNPSRFESMNYTPFTGKAVGVVDIYRTNRFHTYQKAWGIVKEDRYNTVHRYENDPQGIPDIYELGGYLTNVLREDLNAGQTYLLSTMIRLSNESSFGLRQIGVYFLSEIPEDRDDSLLERIPDAVFNTSPESGLNLSEWQELSTFYEAKGNERYVVFGFIKNNDYPIYRNTEFRPVEFSSCGPFGGYDCHDKVITYKDSLFARYSFDNVVLFPVYGAKNFGAEIYRKDRHHHFFLTFDLGGDKTNNVILENLKPILFQSLHGLPYQYSIDLVLIGRSYKRQSYSWKMNQSQLVSSISKLKINRRPGSTKIPQKLLEFDFDKQPINSSQKYILITDGHLNREELITHLSHSNREIKFTIIYLGAQSGFAAFKKEFQPFPHVEVIFFRDEMQSIDVFQSIWR
jgi:hypothetical protein